MILAPDGRTLWGSVTDHCSLDHIASELQHASESFLDSTASVWPLRKSIHVFQGECAEVYVNEGVLVGSTDATTCAIVVMLDPSSGKATVCHHDEITCKDPSAVLQTLNGMQAPFLYVSGAYSDRRGTGRASVTALMDAFASSDIPITLRLFCVLGANTDAHGAPRCQSMAVCLRSGQAVHVTEWPDRGPCAARRLAELWLNNGGGEDGGAGALRRVYCPEKRRIEAELVQGAVPHSTAAVFQELIDCDDAELLQRCSTSPEHEMPHIAEEMRESFRWALEGRGTFTRRKIAYEWRDEPKPGWYECTELSQNSVISSN